MVGSQLHKIYSEGSTFAFDIWNLSKQNKSLKNRGIFDSEHMKNIFSIRAIEKSRKYKYKNILDRGNQCAGFSF